MNNFAIRLIFIVAVSTLMMPSSFAKQPPANITSDAAKHEANLLTKPQRDQLQVEMISLQRDIIAAHRSIDKLSEVKAAKDEMHRLRKERAARKEIIAASAKYNELKQAELNKDPILAKKLERYEYVASLLEYDKLRNKVNRARMLPEDIAAARPKVNLARPVYEKIVEKKEQAQAIVEDAIDRADEEISHNVIKLFKNDEVLVAGKRVAWSDLSSALAELYKQEPELELLVDGEIDTPVSKLLEMMKLARAAGFKDVSIRKLF